MTGGFPINKEETPSFKVQGTEITDHIFYDIPFIKVHHIPPQPVERKKWPLNKGMRGYDLADLTHSIAFLWLLAEVFLPIL